MSRRERKKIQAAKAALGALHAEPVDDLLTIYAMDTFVSTIQWDELRNSPKRNSPKRSAVAKNIQQQRRVQQAIGRVLRRRP